MEPVYREQAVTFDCDQDTLVGVITHPKVVATHGLLVVVGGPQYRVGSHRQFLLIARALAARGIATMRFDYRGMGDSTGAMRNFEQVSEDIRAAVNQFQKCVKGLSKIVLWGLCDGASAAILYAHADTRVSALVALNPWVRTEAGVAKTYLRHYYTKRVFETGFWRKALAGGLDLKGSIQALAQHARRAASSGRGPASWSEDDAVVTLPERMADGLSRFRGRVLLVLSGNDLTAKEFEDVTNESPRWRAILHSERVSRIDLPGANHTFSTRAWRERVIDVTHRWVAGV